jgi:hypothetical protein
MVWKGGDPYHYPILSNRYEQDDKAFIAKILLEFVEF